MSELGTEEELDLELGNEEDVIAFQKVTSDALFWLMEWPAGITQTDYLLISCFDDIYEIFTDDLADGVYLSLGCDESAIKSAFTAHFEAELAILQASLAAKLKELQSLHNGHPTSSPG